MSCICFHYVPYLSVCDLNNCFEFISISEIVGDKQEKHAILASVAFNKVEVAPKRSNFMPSKAKQGVVIRFSTRGVKH